MEERVVDYFVVAGLRDDQLQQVDEQDYCEGLNPTQQDIEPITDITVIFPSLGEFVPKGFRCIEHTPSGFPANLNSGSIRSPEVFLCYRRGRDKPPLVDIGVMYDGKERLLPDAEVVLSTPEGRPANVNNTNARTLLTFRRAPENMPCNELVVTDICVIFQNKGEKPPHAFCLIQKNLNKGMMGCDVFLCYKKSMYRPPLLSFKPEVLLRYPPVDSRTSPLPQLTATFCLPMCATIECWPKKALQPRPVFSTFVLTVADGTEKIYGAGITFYEQYAFSDNLSKDQKENLGYVSQCDRDEKRLHVNKCICLLSHYPFFDAFRTFLFYLYWMARNGSHEVPIERYISHILEEVPFPSAQRPHIFMQLSPTQNILLSHPHDSPLPKSGASFRSVLNNLGPDNCLLVMLLVLTEQKLLIHSLRPDVLTSVAEAISVLIFPFRWQCPYIPLCPLGLCGVLQAPVPFLIGVDSRFFDLYEPPSDVTCIDLDTNTITVSEDKRHILNVKLLPKKPARVLKTALENIKIASEKLSIMSRANIKGINDANEVMDIDFQQKRRERSIEMEIQASFLRFMTTILKGYRSYLLPITKAPTIGATDASSLFDFQGFLRSRDKTYQKFYSFMLKTQMFIRFIEERSFVSENDSCLEFFDDCVDKIENDETESVKLLELNEGNQSERIVFVMPPEPTELPPNTKYCYNSKFLLKEGLFPGPKLKSLPLDRLIQQSEQSSPGSPVAKRTKQEIRSAQRIAKKFSEKPHLWAKYLLSTCYSIWFIHLPSYVSGAPSKHMALCLAYEILTKMSTLGLQPADEICYRVVMQLCGLYNQPVIAVKVLLKMKRCGMTPNAMTYGYYNKAVLEAKWPSNFTNSSQLNWNKLRNVIIGVAQFRAATRSKNLEDVQDESDKISSGSGISLDNQNPRQGNFINKFQASPSLVNPQVMENDGRVKSQSDSDVPNTPSATIPTRISSSSDVGYDSMHEPKGSGSDIADVGCTPNTSEKQAKAAKFWGKMGQSLDQWVKSGVSSLASLAVESSYYSQGGLLMGGGYAGDFTNCLNQDLIDEDDDDGEIEMVKKEQNKKKSRKRLDFGDESPSRGTPEERSSKENQTLRLLRSVSFGNDTQIMSKLRILKNDGGESASKSKRTDVGCPRSASFESNSSLESKVKQYYESRNSSRDVSAEKSFSSASREITPIEDESHESYQDTVRPGQLHPPISARININEKNLSGDLPTNSPARTPVTQDDPLGALSEPCSPEKKETLSKGTHLSEGTSKDSPKRTCSESHIGGLSESSTSKSTGSGGFHRSNTLPNYGSNIVNGGSNLSMNSTASDDKISCAGPGSSSTVSSLAAFSSNLKNPFGRYSPGRLSLRKAGTSFIESTIGGKKAEALMEGFNQFKSVAAVTVKTKLEELKEAVGNNSTPGKNGPFGRYDDEICDESEAEPCSDQWASVSESYLDQLLTTEPCSARGSFASVDYGLGANIPDSPMSSSRQSLTMPDHLKAIGSTLGNTFSNRPSHHRPTCLELNLTTCSVCHNCSSLLFDEEIMAGWTAEDSNLNTRCPHCKKWEVPFLEVTVVDYRHNPMPCITSYPVTSTSSFENVNISRRGSVNENPVILKDNSEPCPSDEPGTNDAVGETETDGLCLSKSNDDDLLLPSDPLGVLEELHRSRRNSPDPDIESNPNPNTAQATENPEILENNVPELIVSKLEGITREPIVVPYLSPLVLRKELENVLDHEGDACLLQSNFVDEHPIIYWNLVWFFHRSNLPSHVKGLCLNAKSIVGNPVDSQQETENGDKLDDECNSLKHPSFIHPSWDGVDFRNVTVNCMWDNAKHHSQYTVPLYLEWQRLKSSKTSSTKSEEDNNINRIIGSVVKSAQGGTLVQICPQLLYYYHKNVEQGGRHYPAYRDILFLALLAGRESLESYGYGLDREYRDVYSKLRNNDDYESMDVGDTPPTDCALFCRRYFRELQLLTYT